jgi:hypothetical protein
VFKRLKESSNRWSHWELSASLARIPIGSTVDVIVETESFKEASDDNQQEWTLAIRPPAKFGVISMWVLLPAESYFAGYDLYERISPADESMQKIEPTTGNTNSSGAVLAWSLVNPQPEHIYECHWVQIHVTRVRDLLRSLGN